MHAICNKSNFFYLKSFLLILDTVLLASQYEINHDVFTMKYGHFLPKYRYNIDKVPLLFVVNQELTFTNKNNKDVHLSVPSDALRKC